MIIKLLARMMRRALLSCSILLIFSLHGQAQTTLPEIVFETDQPPAADNITEQATIDGRDVIETPAGPVDGYRALTSSGSTKTDTPVEEIPQTITIIPKEIIEDQNNTSVSEALRNSSSVIPGARIGTPTFESSRVRGFSTDVLIDGLTAYYSPGDPESLINVERIEILKGPNGFLYGGGIGNPVGGAINIVTKQPEDKQFGTFGLQLGSYEHAKAFFDINQPLSKNILFRFNGNYVTESSYIDVLEADIYNFNPSLKLRSDDKDTSLLIQGRLSRWKQQEYQGLPAVGTVAANFSIDPELFIGPGDIPRSTSEYDGITLTFDHKLNATWSFNVKGRLSQSEFEENAQIIFGNTPDVDPALPSSFFLANAQLFQEQEEQSITGYALGKFNHGITKNKLVIGADYSRLKDEGFLNFVFADPFFADLTNPTFGEFVPPPGLGNDQFVTNEIYGAFVQLQTTIWDRVHLLAGVRGANINIDFSNTTAGTNSVTDEFEVLPRFGAVVDLTPAISVFAGYSEGARGQPFSDFIGTPKPELSDQIEGGIKFNFNNRLTGTLSVYEINRENVAVAIPDGTFRSSPTGEQRSRGFEADILWQVNKAWKVLANYAYTDAEFTKADEVAGIAKGNKLNGVPEHAGRFWVNYDFQDPKLKGLSAGVGIYLSSEKFVTNANEFETDSFYTIDAKVGYETDSYKASVAVKNLTDNEYFDVYDYFEGRVFQPEGTTVFGSVAFKY